MNILSTSGWEDYCLLDSGDGYRLEKFGKYKIARPDPSCLWRRKLGSAEWDSADALFAKDKDGRERWIIKNKMPEKWLMKYNDLSFYAKLASFKHTGVFPEQHLMWDFIESRIKNQELREKDNKIKILNLFAYTGIASLVAAREGCEVTHVDASAPSIGWARDNQALSKLADKPIRWIREDTIKYCQRELRRGHKYDGIVMDPPVYGHGPSGEVWDFNRNFPELLKTCVDLLSEKPIFVLINAYAVSASAIMLENMMADYFVKYGGLIDSGELCIEEKDSKRLLSTGIFARWSHQ